MSEEQSISCPHCGGTGKDAPWTGRWCDWCAGTGQRIERTETEAVRSTDWLGGQAWSAEPTSAGWWWWTDGKLPPVIAQVLKGLNADGEEGYYCYVNNGMRWPDLMKGWWAGAVEPPPMPHVEQPPSVGSEIPTQPTQNSNEGDSQNA